MATNLYTAVKCSCGDRSCKDWHVSGIAKVWGVKFDEAQANAVARLLTLMDQRVGEARQIIVPLDEADFEAFLATKLRCENLGIALSDATLVEVKGWLYASHPPHPNGHTGGLYIEDAGAGGYHLLIENDSEVTSDLAGLERRLYDFALAIGFWPL
jgi:hypothetical protein